MAIRTAETARRQSGQPVRILLALIALVAVALAGTKVVAPSDVALYQRYAHAMWHGPLSAGLPGEYPALAGALFLGVAGLPGSYLAAFAVCMAVCLALLVFWGSRSVEDEGWAQRLLLYLGLSVATVMLFRFDLLPAACAFVAVVCARRERYGRAWAAAWLGAALKFFPGLLLPGFFIYEWRREGRPPWRRMAAAGAATVAMAILQSVVAPGTLWGPIRYEGARGFEFSSVPGSISLILSGGHLTWMYGFGNWQVVGPAHTAIAAVMAIIEVGGLAAVWWCLARRRLGVEAASLAVLSIAVLTDRALAPQYLIWLAPLWALWPVRRSWIAACLLTLLTFPVALELHMSYGWGAGLPAGVAAIRNVVLIAGTTSWFCGELRRQTISPQLRLKTPPIRRLEPVGLSTPPETSYIVGMKGDGLYRGQEDRDVRSAAT